MRPSGSPADAGANLLYRGAADEFRKGAIAFNWGELWHKGQYLGTGPCNVKNYNRRSCPLIHEGKAKPSFLIPHELPPRAPKACQHFDAREDGWTKVVLKPAA